MAAEDPLHHLSAEQRRRGSLRLIRALFPERFAGQQADSSASCTDGDEAELHTLTGAPDSCR